MARKIFKIIFCILFFCPAARLCRQAEARAVFPVEGLCASDMPYDAGGAVLLRWNVMPFEGGNVGYRVLASSSPAGPWKPALDFPSTERLAGGFRLPFWAWDGGKDLHAVKVGLDRLFPPRAGTLPYYFSVETVDGKHRAQSPVVSAAGEGNWFNLARLNSLICVVLFCAAFFAAVRLAKRRKLFVRRMEGLDASLAAVEKAAGSGRPVYFLTGYYGMENMSTVAATFILGEIARKTASLGVPLKVPHKEAVTMSACREIVREAYAGAGKSASYTDDINFFVSSDQFSYTAAVDGMISREKPSVCFFMGYYYAEALLLAEVGAGAGAVQIAGTDADHQLPFFFTSCDYTLMGEELYAAGAYLSGDPVLTGTLRAQDAGKVVVIAAVVLGLAASTAALLLGREELSLVLADIFHVF